MSEREPIWQRVIEAIRLLAVQQVITERERDRALERAKRKFGLKERG